MATAVTSIMLVAAIHSVGVARLSQHNVADRNAALLLANDLLSEILQQDYCDPDYGLGSFGRDASQIGDGSPRVVGRRR